MGSKENASSELDRLKELRDQGTISESQYEVEKTALLARVAKDTEPSDADAQARLRKIQGGIVFFGLLVIVVIFLWVRASAG